MATPMTEAQWKTALTKFKVPVKYRAGWHANGRSAAHGAWGPLQGVVIHHTADADPGTSTAYQKFLFDTGRTDLPGPLCHAAGTNDTKGTIVMGAGGRANHAGAGAAKVLDHVIGEDYDGYKSELKPGTASGPDGNARFYGLEICYAGVKGTAPTTAQYDSAVRWAAAICDHHGWSALSVIGHREWTSAKVDPYAIKMNQFRTDVQALLDGGEITPPPVVVEPPVTKPKAAVWGKPATWVLGATGADVTKLGERIVIWSKALGLKSPYKVGPGSPMGPADVAGLSALQVAWGYGSTKTDLAKGGNSDGYPGPATFTKLESDPPAKSDPPKPSGKTETLKVLFLPTAGYNADTAKGVTDWKKNTDGLVALVKKHEPDLIGTTEMSARHQDPMLPRFEKAVPDYSKDDSGSDGRFVFRDKATTDNIASGVVSANADTELNDDDKQAAWSLNKTTGGTPVGMISLHTENQDGVDKSGTNKGENADTLRVDQTQSMVHRAMSQIKAAGGDEEHTIVVGDTNSVSMVKDAMVAEGWTPIGPGYFHGWDHHTKKTFDWAFIKGGTATVQVIDHEFSDHTALLITWTFPV